MFYGIATRVGGGVRGKGFPGFLVIQKKLISVRASAVFNRLTQTPKYLLLVGFVLHGKSVQRVSDNVAVVQLLHGSIATKFQP